jgi:hypothetical protein
MAMLAVFLIADKGGRTLILDKAARRMGVPDGFALGGLDSGGPLSDATMLSV